MKSVSLVLVTSFALFASCASSSSSTVPSCAECREFAVHALQIEHTGRGFRTESRKPHVHDCSCCKVQIRVESDEGGPVLHCTVCAPKGVNCEACEAAAKTESPAAGTSGR